MIKLDAMTFSPQQGWVVMTCQITHVQHPISLLSLILEKIKSTDGKR